MKIVISCVDGSVHVMSIVGDADIDDCIKRWESVHVGMYASHRSMPDSAIPTDREFRAAWSDTTPALSIDIDMSKARAVHMANLRAKRNAELSKLDIDATKAQDTGDSSGLASIRSRKQALRDMPQTIKSKIDAANSVSALKAIQPI